MAANDVAQSEITTRLQHVAQKKWRKPLEEYVFNRVVHVRSGIRSASTSIVLSAYPLTGRICNVTDFTNFIRKKLRYIYPQEVTLSTQPRPAPSEQASTSAETSTSRSQYTDARTLLTSKPSDQNPAIIAALRSLFSGTSSPGVVHRNLFRSSVDDNNEVEIPMAMLAMVAATIHFCLGEWSSGSFVSIKFDGNVVREEYNENIICRVKANKNNFRHFGCFWLFFDTSDDFFEFF
ncbi:hypothetical protein K435DRAFT_810726 [Dendrothele bispora CBS 962.96]|uniref:DUF6532 domain-containing protein n=1 Tax=Dendrothele bispora (strain CBS 962.96) TaxID=1314807 RepID=A0A4S8KVB0_DENBC|nr:hypothetical protein K435DRAFT_810726 [Dendrothele bispora CBS 962.96]